MQVQEIKDPYQMPPVGESLRQYYERCGYLGSFDNLSEASLQSLEQERCAEIAIAKMAEVGPMVFLHEGYIYKRYPDGKIEQLRRG
ncbi:MAG: hypothetical protein Q4G70_09555 [Pseudomonadota bacterium]|nr:hypothetical protein [Pseudomonadota bacterium]